jgi:hypothetical protein
MTRDQMPYRLVDEDLGQPYDQAAADMLSKALAAHMSTAGSAARVTLEPMSREESLRLYADYKKIAAYFMIDVEEHLCGSREALLDKLGRRLSVLPVADVHYDIVWGKGRSLMVHVEAKLVT